MKNILSVLLVVSYIFVMILPTAEASSRIRKLHKYQDTYNSQNTYNNQSSQVQDNYVPKYPILPAQETAKYTYYFSTEYIQGYTYSPTPHPGYYFYHTLPTLHNTPRVTIRKGSYSYSANPISGYTYYSSPTPGYYSYLPVGPALPYPQSPYIPPVYHHPSYDTGNTNCTNVGGVYQCKNNSTVSTYLTYPGCSSQDILIGGQIWASCNSTDRNIGSTTKSGWFFAGERQSVYVSNNGNYTALQWMGKKTRERSWNIGPCASGYRLPTRAEWEMLQSYARANETSLAKLISLEQNGGYQSSRNSSGEVGITGRLSILGGYWTSSTDSGIPIVMHIGSSYAGYATNSTDYIYGSDTSQWRYTDMGLELIRSTTGELANVRCIRD